MKVMQISASDTYKIRQQMLRPGRDISCIFQGDDDDQTIHLGAFIDKNLVSVASFYFNNNPRFNETSNISFAGWQHYPSIKIKGSVGSF